MLPKRPARGSEAMQATSTFHGPAQHALSYQVGACIMCQHQQTVYMCSYGLCGVMMCWLQGKSWLTPPAGVHPSDGDHEVCLCVALYPTAAFIIFVAGRKNLALLYYSMCCALIHFYLAFAYHSAGVYSKEMYQAVYWSHERGAGY